MLLVTERGGLWTSALEPVLGLRAGDELLILVLPPEQSPEVITGVRPQVFRSITAAW
ncbi:hypothetical protein [Microvirga pakistanensis]|uniref:hypothetical protein n=1 Tax=Microvirga pakistanensis TaxID=1682650 RepID=UPI00141A7E7A|nr:hypothetical protein [Microvirga pakistanensis]